jgi:hypothetical protein
MDFLRYSANTYTVTPKTWIGLCLQTLILMTFPRAKGISLNTRLNRQIHHAFNGSMDNGFTYNIAEQVPTRG